MYNFRNGMFLDEDIKIEVDKDSPEHITKHPYNLQFHNKGGSFMVYATLKKLKELGFAIQSFIEDEYRKSEEYDKDVDRAVESDRKAKELSNV